MKKRMFEPAKRRLKRSSFIRESIPDILSKTMQIEPEKRALALDYMEQTYPKELWTHAYTDGSAEEVTRNGGGGIFLIQKDGTHIRQAIPTGKFSRNYKAEADALQTASETLYEEMPFNPELLSSLTHCQYCRLYKILKTKTSTPLSLPLSYCSKPLNTPSYSGYPHTVT